LPIQPTKLVVSANREGRAFFLVWKCEVIMSPAVGIDLGTTNSVIAHINSTGRAEVIANAEGSSLTPSVIYFGSDPPLVGAQAKEMQRLGENGVASFFKRSMGDPNFLLHLGGRDWSATDLSVLVLRKLKADAEVVLKQPITQAVITVPAYFNTPQREATIVAGKRACMDVLRIINEPTAAAMAYSLTKAREAEVVMVYDLGGGTFDVSLVELGPQHLKVIATAGDHNLGGKDWDDRIAAYLDRQFAEAHGVCPLEDSVTFNDMLVRAENAKKTLSAREVVRVPVHHGGKQETIELTRAIFADLTRDLMERTQALADQVLRDAGRSWTNLAGVLLVGGSTRMPMVHDFVRAMSGKPPKGDVNVDEAVALGAAVQAALVVEEAGQMTLFLLPCNKAIQDVTAHGLGVISESADRARFFNSTIVPRNSPLPASGEKLYQVRPRKDGTIECIVYVTEGDGDNPCTVAVRGKYVCTGPATSACADGLNNILVQYAYDKNGTIRVSATEATSGKPFQVASEPVEDLSWLVKSPRELDSFDTSTLDLVITPPGFDNIGAVLQSLGLFSRAYQGPRDILCDILFINCGTSTTPSPQELRRFVEGGGCVYASDLTDGLVSEAFPGLFDFAGHLGQPASVWAEVVDSDLRNALGKKIKITFDMGGWAVLTGVAREVRVLLRSTDTSRPFMVMAKHGQGTLFYTCFHNHAQTSGAEQALLKLLVLKQISVVSGIPIEAVSRAKGLIWNA
jgi:molecular chaperone DnaK (HSP70)